MRCSNKLVFGVGINDNIDTRYNGIVLDSYNTWIHMIKRCYSNVSLLKRPTYIDCSVCDEWKYYSNFKSWFDEHYIDGYELDKDILINGNKIYSPNTCCFIPHYINKLFNNKKKHKLSNTKQIGVYFDMNIHKFQVYISKYGKRQHLGYFNSESEAHNVLLIEKRKYCRELAINAYMNTEIDERIMNAIIKKAYDLT